MKEKILDSNFVLFAEAHALYPGRKRFVTTEFKNLKDQHKDWKEVLPILKETIQRMIDWKESKLKAGEFVPEHKNLCNYIDGRWFEEDIPLVKSVHSYVNGENKPEKQPYF